jgi:hypothetical protein
MSLSPRAKTIVLFWACITSSLLGIILAVFVTCDPADGGRGGAVAVALALFNLFISKNYGLRLFEARTTIPRLIAGFQKLGKLAPTLAEAALTPDKLAEEVTAALKTDNTEQNRLNWYLAFSTFVGTLAWGFGDIVAKWGVNFFCKHH